MPVGIRQTVQAVRMRRALDVAVEASLPVVADGRGMTSVLEQH